MMPEGIIMRAKENYETRNEMAQMHDEYIASLSDAYESKKHIEVVWLCYAIFEQRISRLITKYIDNCTVPERTDKKSAAISTRIKCLQKQIDTKYGAFDGFDSAILTEIQRWCEDRNELVHGLVSLQHYRQYDEEFAELATRGFPLVSSLYDSCTSLRDRWYKSDNPVEEFPMQKCQCKKNKCINPNIG
jgi:hypothetical protein